MTTDLTNRCRRILMLTQRFPYPPNRGDRIRSYNLLRFLAQHFRVSLACTSDEPIPGEASDHLRSICQDLYIATSQRLPRLLHVAQAGLIGRSLTEGHFFSAQLAAHVRHWQQSAAFDAIVVFCSSMFQYAEQACFQQTPIVVDLVDVDSLKWEQLAQQASWPRRWLYAFEARRVRQLEQRLTRRARHVGLISQAEAGLFTQRLRTQLPHSSCDLLSKVFAAGNGVDTHYFCASDRTPTTSNSIELIFTGVLDYPPNVAGIIWFCEQVFPKLNELGRERQLAFHLKVVGRRPTHDVRRLGEIAGVDIVGEVVDVRPSLHKADIAISPLHLARGIQNKVLEAMASGLPVVLTSQSAEGIEASDGEHFLIADNIDDFAASIIKLACDNAARLSMGRAARELVVSQYNWSARLDPFRTVLSNAFSA